MDQRTEGRYRHRCRAERRRRTVHRDTAPRWQSHQHPCPRPHRRTALLLPPEDHHPRRRVRLLHRCCRQRRVHAARRRHACRHDDVHACRGTALPHHQLCHRALQLQHQSERHAEISLLQLERQPWHHRAIHLERPRLALGDTACRGRFLRPQLRHRPLLHINERHHRSRLRPHRNHQRGFRLHHQLYRRPVALAERSLDARVDVSHQLSVEQQLSDSCPPFRE